MSTGGERRTWAQYIAGPGHVDEEKVVQPVAFPAFAAQCLGWQLQVDLAPEEAGVEGKPDFTPADSVTHPFVFETKGTKEGVVLAGHDFQVLRYLRDGAPRIKTVVVTNLVGAMVYDLDANQRLHLRYAVNLKGLLAGAVELVAPTASAERLADFLDEFSRKHLTADEKIAKIRTAPPWNPVAEVTSSDWILGRIDRIVSVLTRCVTDQISVGVLTDTTRTTGDERKWITDELRLLGSRLGVNGADTLTLAQFLAAREDSLTGKAVQQYAAHVAYYAATRLMLVRVWEDLGLLEPMLYDGGFDRQMTRFDDALGDVVVHSFAKAKDRYRSLFDQRNSYTWFTPDDTTYADVIYELANTYLGAVQSDVLGQVYERLLERIDRKLLGVYYTPRDVIALIWDLIDLDAVADRTEPDGREPSVLDIATGSGGFLVEAGRRLRERVTAQQAAGADVHMQTWVNRAADGLNGVELNRFSAYLAELNLLVQFGQVIANDPTLRLPPMGVLSADTLSLHNPDTLLARWQDVEASQGLLSDDEDRKTRAQRIKAAAEADCLMDVACGNPPYIGEKTAAPLLAQTRRDYPYWNQFVAQHLDYLYWFVILGVSKLRPGGRFGFITSEYWLRAGGAKPLREYLATRCHIERIVLFRDFRPFEDAQGHHSMIVVGTRVADHDQSPTLTPAPAHKPKVSIYDGGPITGAARKRVLTAIRDSKTAGNVRTFAATVSPNTLGANSWADVVLTKDQLTQRAHLTLGAQIALEVTEGVIPTANRLTTKTEPLLTVGALQALGGPGTGAGIYLLTDDEVRALGTLNDAELAVVRRVVNTKDIYPYAVVLPDHGTKLIYLPKPTNIDPKLTDDQVRNTPFPSGLPTLQAHLQTFHPLLDAKVAGFGERRPWWTLHRARTETVGDAGSTSDVWANYLVMARWGPGGRLTVGRAPAGTSPASGLHVLRPRNDALPASYLAALYSSTLYQEIADSLPPGQLRKADLQAIGIPLRQSAVRTLADTADTLAAQVTDLVRVHVPRFPLLGESLRGNIALTDLTDYTWTPGGGSTTTHGPLHQVTWVHSVATHRAPSTPLDPVVDVTDDILGQRIHIRARGTDRIAVTITLEQDVDCDVVTALAAAVRGVIETGGRSADLRGLRVPTSPDALSTAYKSDREALAGLASQYRSNRALIDAMLAQAI